MKIMESAPPVLPAPRAPGSPTRQPGARPSRGFARLNVAAGVTALMILCMALTLPRPEGPHGTGLLLGSGIVLLSSLGNLVFKPQRRTARGMWGAALWFSALCVVVITGTWIMVFNDDATEAVPGAQVHDARQVDAYLASAGAAALPRIPTGVFVQSIQFDKAENVKVTGFIWQRLADGLPKGLKAGPALPEAEDAFSLEEVYRVEQGGGETVGWYFKSTLREDFDYDHYPLDFQSVWLRMWPRDMTTQAVLTPDFAAYPPWEKDKVVGLDPGFVGEGWKTSYTTYSYVDNTYDTSMGVRSFNTAPELYFNVGLTRDFLSPLVARLLPVAFVVVLVFLSLFVVTLDAQKRGVMGFSVSGVIGFALSMLLVVTVQHTGVRQATGDSGFVYLEYFYLGMYLVILMTALNAVMTPTKAGRVLRQGGVLLPKVLYWPLFFGLVAAATLATFG